MAAIIPPVAPARIIHPDNPRKKPVQVIAQLTWDRSVCNMWAVICIMKSGASMTMPLYQSGAEHSDVRAAREVASQRRIEIEQNRRTVLEA